MYEYVFIFYNNYFQILKIEMLSLILFSLLVICFATGSVFSAPAFGSGFGSGSGDDTPTGKPIAVSPINRTEKPIEAQQVSEGKSDKDKCIEDPSMEWKRIRCVEYAPQYIHRKECITYEYGCGPKPPIYIKKENSLSDGVVVALVFGSFIGLFWIAHMCDKCEKKQKEKKEKKEERRQQQEEKLRKKWKEEDLKQAEENIKEFNIKFPNNTLFPKSPIDETTI